MRGDRIRSRELWPRSANDTLFGIFGQVVILGNLGKELAFEHAGVGIAESVIFLTPVADLFLFSGTPVLASFDLVSEDTRVDEESDGDRDLSFVDEVIENDSCAGLTLFIDIGVTILKHHHGGGLIRFVLGWDVEVILSNSAVEDFALMIMTSDFSDGDSVLSV